MAENTVADLKKFFSTSEKPVSLKEYKDFWDSLSEQEKDYYRKADLS